MNVLDIILLLCFVPAIIGGLRRGFIAQVVAIISIILGIWLSFKFSAVLSGWLGQWIEAGEQVLHVISFAVILILAILALAAVGKLIEATVKIILLGWLNRLLGLIFALLKYALIIGLLLMLFNSLNGQFHLVNQKVLDSSLLYGPLLNMANSVFPYLKALIFWN